MPDHSPSEMPLQRETLAHQVVERLREAILSGEYPLGAALSEAEIARRYGISRGPVREAVQRLIQEGLLTSEPHRGVRVPDLNDGDLIDIYRARRAIEGAALSAVLAKARGAALAEELEATLAEMRGAAAAEVWDRLGRLDLTFHSQIVGAADSHRLRRMYRTLVAEMRLCLKVLLDGYRGRQGIVESHAILVDLIRAGDEAPLLAALTEHLDEPVRSLRAQRDEETTQRRPAAQAP